MSAENSNIAMVNEMFEKSTAILLDVAGTTTSSNFVKETLFPFVLKEVDSYLKEHQDEDAVKEAIKALKEEGKLDLEEAIAAIKELTEAMSDNKGLKTIQGMIYKVGYESGDIKAHVFDDVKSFLESNSQSRKVAIYSTGSVEAQKMMFAHTVEGDLSAHISKYFDQSVGAKTEAASYEKIAKELEVKPEEIFFVTDLAEEAKAAKSAGLNVAIVKRYDAEVAEDIAKEFSVITSFNELSAENPAKRKIEDAVTSDEAPPSKIAKTESEVEKVEEAKETETEVAEEAMEVDSGEKKEDKAEVKTDVEETKAETEKEVTESETAKPAAEEKVIVEEKVEETKTEKESDEKDSAEEETIESEEISKAEVEEPKQNGNKVEENGKHEDVVEEKENNSELANGVVENGKSETDEKTEVTEAAADETTEVKSKKIVEGDAENAPPPVSVEV